MLLKFCSEFLGLRGLLHLCISLVKPEISEIHLMQGLGIDKMKRYGMVQAISRK